MDKIALITGSGRRRLGMRVAEALAGRGYALAIHYHSSAIEAAATADQLRRSGVEVEAFHANLAVETEASGLVESALARFGRLDVLVNCAAVWERRRLEETTADDLRRHFEINVLGTFFCARAAGLAMARQVEGGCIVNLGDWAIARPYLDYAAYFASKGSIPTLTRCLAVELGTRNPRVRVNAILPGPVLLPTVMDPAERSEAIDATLARREGRPENIALAVLYLIDNDYVTGDCLHVDGGRTIYAGGL